MSLFGRNRITGDEMSTPDPAAANAAPGPGVFQNLKETGNCLVPQTNDWHLICHLEDATRKGKWMVSLRDARKVMAAAENKAAEIGQPMNIAVVDQGGNLVAHIRMDGAPFGAIDISINKAFTSSACEISTRDLAAHSQPRQPFFGIHASNHGRIMIFAGGIPLKRDGKVAGAIGVSGGSGDQDQAVAQAGADAF